MIHQKDRIQNKLRAIEQEQLPHSDEAGYTILESIVAMVVVAVLMTAVAPVIVFSGATRLQARRVELATQAARSYMDWVRADPTNRAPAQTVNLAAGVTNFPAPPNAPAVPSTAALVGDCTTNNGYCSDNIRYCVNFDETAGCQTTSLRDMVVQGFRSAPVGVGTPTAKQGYLLGVRVYRANAFGSGGTLKTTQPTTNVTNALGDQTAALVTMTAEIGSSATFDDYTKRLNSSSPSPSP